MKIEHYRVNRKGECFVRWRIVDEEDGALIVQGKRFHKTWNDSRAEIGELTEFLDAVARERVGKALRGEL